MSSDFLCVGKAVQTNPSCHLLDVQLFPDSSGPRLPLDTQLSRLSNSLTSYSWSTPWKSHWFCPGESSKRKDDRQASSQQETGAPSLLRENKSCFQFSWCCNGTWSPKEALLLFSVFKAFHLGGKVVSRDQGPQSCFRTAAGWSLLTLISTQECAIPLTFVHLCKRIEMSLFSLSLSLLFLCCTVFWKHKKLEQG